MVIRNPLSHKGQNGTVAVIGGSHLFHGAPIFSALAAERSGVDLIYLFVHRCNAEVTKAASLNFIVRTFKEGSLDKEDVKHVLALLREVHSAVIGPGMAETPQNAAALSLIVANAPCSLVLDARALRAGILKYVQHKKSVVLTPHIGELEKILNKSLTDVPKKDVYALVKGLAKKTGTTVILKGPEDFVASAEGATKTVSGGNAGLTKGGTGDALSGLIAGLMAQGMEPFDACVLGTETIKKAGEHLRRKQGFGYTTKEVVEGIPPLLKE